MLKLSIRSKLILALSSLLMGAFAFSTAYYYKVAKDTIEETLVNETLPLITNNIYTEIKNDLLTPVHIATLMAHDAELLGWSEKSVSRPESIVAYLEEVRKKYLVQTAFYVNMTTMKYHYHGGILKTMSRQDPRDDWFFNLIESSQQTELSVNPDVVSDGRLVVFTDQKVLDKDGKLLGVTGVGMDLERVGDTLQTYRELYGRNIIMLDSRGVIQLHPRVDLVLAKNLADLYGGLGDLAEDILSVKAGLTIYNLDYDGRRIYLAVRYLQAIDWFLVVAQDRDTFAMEELRGALTGGMLVGFAATLAAIGLMAFAVRHFQGRLEAMATTDELTGCANRRAFMDVLRDEVARAHRYQKNLSLLALDIDHFKAINDNHGHGVGDIVLCRVVDTIENCLRSTDKLGRVGGEEFGVILPETNCDQAGLVAERIRCAVQKIVVQAGSCEVRLTISIGYCQAPLGCDDINDLLNMADEALYRAKGGGRNQVCHYLDETE